jgi:hypothetical protein
MTAVLLLLVAAGAMSMKAHDWITATLCLAAAYGLTFLL